MSNRSKHDVEAALDRYFQGHATGSPEVMRTAFHPSARVQFLRSGEYAEWSLDEYLAKLPGAPADDEPLRTRRLLTLETADTSATALLELDYPAVRFVDHMTLLRIDGEWTIVNKVFEAHPKA